MAFTGSAVVVQVSDRIVRITGLSLAAGAAGTLGLFENSGAPGVRLPQAFKPRAYAYDEATVNLVDSIDVTTKPDATGTTTAIPVSVVKTGDEPVDWVATLTNTHGSTATPELEIYVKFHD